MRDPLPTRSLYVGFMILVILLGPTCGEDIGPMGGRVHNRTDERVLVFAVSAVGDESIVGGAGPLSTGTLEYSCSDPVIRNSVELVARHDEGPVIDTWPRPFCSDDHWVIPRGGLIENKTGGTITVQSGDESSNRVTLEPGAVGSLEGPCTDPPLNAGTDLARVDKWELSRDAALCADEVWVISDL